MPKNSFSCLRRLVTFIVILSSFNPKFCEWKKEVDGKFIFASTCSNYGISDPNIFASENSKLNPVSLYAETKIDCEKYLSENSDDNMKIVCLRFGTAFGVSKRTRFDLTINSFVYEALKKKKIYLYAPNSWRPYIHVNDMAKIILKFIQSNSFANSSSEF